LNWCFEFSLAVLTGFFLFRKVVLVDDAMIASVCSVFQYPGGKARIAGWIADLLPPPGSYSCFVDVFGGAANVLLEVMHRNEVAGIRVHYVFNDKNEDIVNFFRVIRNKATREELIEMLRWTPYSRKQFTNCIEMPIPADPVERAWRFFVLIQQSFSGVSPFTPGRWGYDLSGKCVNTWLHSQERLEFYGELFRRVQIECLDFADLLRRYDNSMVLVYCDPPYYPDTRIESKSIYEHELSGGRHRELAELLNAFSGMAAISGYRCTEYDTWYKDWERHDRDISCSMSQIGGVGKWKGMSRPRRTESLWLNPKATAARGSRFRQKRLF